MKFIFLGTGSAFTMNNFHSNFIIERDCKNLLIDAGGDIRHSLGRAMRSYKDIDSLYVTHLHDDHVGGMGYLALCSYFDPGKEKIKLYGNEHVIEDLWDHALRGGLSTVQAKHMGLKDYFDIHTIPKNEGFTWQDIEFRIVQSVHVVDEYSIMDTYGLMIKDPDSNKKIYFTGDTQFNPNQIIDFYNSADAIIQDCETAPYMSKVHAHYKELKTLPKKVKKKMWLIHYSDNVNQNREDWNEKCHNDGFRGFLSTGVHYNVHALTEEAVDY